MVNCPTGFLRYLLPVALGAAAGVIASRALIVEESEGTAKKLAAAVITPTGEPLTALLTADRRTSASPALFFGSVEFDQDGNAPGGVPGFGLWPATQAEVAGWSN